MKVIYFLILITAICSYASYTDTSSREVISDTCSNLMLEDSISEALTYQLRYYPEAQYIDVYKNFMQDFFGPGHILADTVASSRYLKQELSDTECFDGPLYEKTGYRGNFYRVNLSLIKDGIIPYEVFFQNFVESVQGIVPPDGDYWMTVWNNIDRVIKKNGLTFQNYDSDRLKLENNFKHGDYIAHHSKRFNDSVNFHYRIISRELFEKNILPLIKEK